MHDVIIVGGSYAGLAAALQLGRARRDVLILDAGQRRNRFATASHGFLGSDGKPPEEIQARGRADVLAYRTVALRETAATAIAKTDGGFTVTAADGEHRARRVILATGVADELPDVPGLAERWGRSVFHCPYCHGFELALGRIGVLATGPMASHHAALVAEWGAPGGTTLFLAGIELDAEQRAMLAARTIRVEATPVVGFEGDAPRIDARLRDGRVVELDGLFLLPRTRIRDAFAAQLGCVLETGPFGAYYKTDDRKETTVPGVFACGDVGQLMPSIAIAVADGSKAGAFTHQSLVFAPPA